MLMYEHALIKRPEQFLSVPEINIGNLHKSVVKDNKDKPTESLVTKWKQN